MMSTRSFLLILFASLANAGDKPTVQSAVTDCSTLTEDAERLACYDSRNVKTEAPRKLTLEELRNEFSVARAIDRHLLKSLRDADSLKDYAVSAVFDCAMLGSTFTGDCACWRGNGKNSYGAYVGIRENAVALFGSFKGEPRELWIITNDLTSGICPNTEYEERDPALIRKKS